MKITSSSVTMNIMVVFTAIWREIMTKVLNIHMTNFASFEKKASPP